MPTDNTATTDLIVSLPAVPNVATFTDEKEFDKLYDAILKKIDEHKPDVSTKKGRDEIASLAYKVARTKTALDKQGKDLTEEWRTNTTKVNATRNKIKDRLEKLQTTVRQPLDDWEASEDARVKKHQGALEMLLSFIGTSMGHPSADLKAMLATVDQIAVDASWEEFEDRASLAKQDAVSALTRLISAAEKQEADAAELAALRAAQAERDRQDAERLAAEEAARAEALRVEREKLAEQQRQDELARVAKAAADRAEREAAERVAAAEREAAEAKARADREIAEAKARAEREAEAERQRVIAAQEAESAEQRRRDADKAHRKTVNNNIVAELVECSGITAEQAQAIVGHLVRGLVPNVTLKY